jgi:hypothetical protein
MSVLDEIAEERRAQDAKWGEQNHPDGTGVNDYDHIVADAARTQCDQAFREGRGTWRHILYEEVSEAFEEPDPEKLRTELIQVCAVAAAWVEAIDRRELPDEKAERMLTELARLAKNYRKSRHHFEESLLAAYDAGVGPTAIAKAVGHLSEGGVRQLVKRRKIQTVNDM